MHRLTEGLMSASGSGAVQRTSFYLSFGRALTHEVSTTGTSRFMRTRVSLRATR